MYFSNTNLQQSIVLKRPFKGPRETCYYIFYTNATARVSQYNPGFPSNATFTYTQCDDFVTQSVVLSGVVGQNTSSVDSPYTCASATRGLYSTPGALNNPNQIFFSPFPCQPETQIPVSTGNYQYVTFNPFLQQVTIPYCLASYIPSGSTSYEYRLIYSGSTYGPIAIESGSAFYSPGASSPQGDVNTLAAISYSVYP